MNSDRAQAPQSKNRYWGFRAAVWFAAASILTTILHELAHATAAWSLGVRSILFNYSVDLDPTPLQATGAVPALIGVAGPAFCLVFGIVSWVAYRRARGPAAELPLLYLSAFGVVTFSGNMMSMSFVGDFSKASDALGLPMIVRYAGTGIGAVVTAGVQFWLGGRLVHWVPVNVGSVVGVLGGVVLPVLLGTSAVIMINQPMPPAFVSARVGEASFSLFAVIGALVAMRYSRGVRGHQEPGWLDVAVVALAVVMVRLMMRGIPFVP